MDKEIIQWSGALGAGIVWMDYQHQTLIEKINQLYAAIIERKAGSFITEVIGFLDEYINYHFSLEEKYMEQFSYPRRDEHVLAHGQFKTNLQELKTQLDTPRELMSESLCYDLYQWFKNHIVTTDASLGIFLKSKLVI